MRQVRLAGAAILAIEYVLASIEHVLFDNPFVLTLVHPAVAIGQQDVVHIDQPHLTLFGSATPQFFYVSLSRRIPERTVTLEPRYVPAGTTGYYLAGCDTTIRRTSAIGFALHCETKRNR